ncbi:MAG: hypothetical protein B7X06_02005, partial [Verrucomicrobia bacterium 21-51-4]
MLNLLEHAPKRLSAKAFPRRDRESLQLFLEQVQLAARASNEPQLVSLSLQCRHLDPLAVLQSIYEPGERHFYLEKPADGRAIAGADAVLEASFEGPDRFADMKRWAQALLKNSWIVGDIDTEGSGLNFFYAGTFYDERESADSA